MDKYDLDEIEVRKRRWGKTLVTRDDLKKDFHIIVNNKSLTTLQNFNTTIGKINAIGQIQSLLINPITWDPYFDMKPVLKDIFDDLDLPCDMELTHKEVMDMRKQQIKDTAKLERMTIKQQWTSQITQAVVQEKVQDKLQERAQKRQADIQAELAEEAEKEIRRQEREARRREVQQPVQQQPQPTDLAPSNNLWLSDQELQLLSQSTWVPIEQILWQVQEQPIIERIEWDTTWVDDTWAEDFGEF